MIFLGDFSFVTDILKNLSCYHDNYFKYFTFGKYNGFVSEARVSACMHACMYFLVRIYNYHKISINDNSLLAFSHRFRKLAF